MGSTVASDFQSSALSARVGPDPLGPLKLWQQRRRRGHRIAPLAPGRFSPGANGAFACPGTRYLSGTRCLSGTRGSPAWRAGSGATEVRGDSFGREPAAGPQSRDGTGCPASAGPPGRTARRADAPAGDIQNGRSLAAYPGQSWEHGSRLPGWIRMKASRPGTSCYARRILVLSVTVGTRLLCG